MALTTEQAARLAQLRAARDKLISGRMVAKATFGPGQTVDYAQADLAALRQEIADLELANQTRPLRRRGAIRFAVR